MSFTPKGSVLNQNPALSTEFVIQLFHKRHLVSVSGFTETYIYLQPVCSFCLAKNGLNLQAFRKFWPVDEKQANVDSTHLNNSDKLSRII